MSKMIRVCGANDGNSERLWFLKHSWLKNRVWLFRQVSCFSPTVTTLTLNQWEKIKTAGDAVFTNQGKESK